MSWEIDQPWKDTDGAQSQTVMQRSRLGLDLYWLPLTPDLVIEDDSKLHISKKGYQTSLAENWT
jgi:hypothetical protein